jgi:uncharacterized Zn finger protein (UPF0148 family)
VRVECESCRKLGVARLAVDGGAVRATCAACGHVTMTALANAPAEVVEQTSDAALCPKCGAVRRTDAVACATCGLAAARMAAFRDARDAMVAEPVRTAWQHANDAWTDDTRHDALFQTAATHNAYAWTAGRYRTRRDSIADRQLERLRRAAEATLLAGATARAEASTRPYRATAGVLAALVIVIAAGLIYAMVVRDRRHALRAHAQSGELVEPAAAAPAPAGPATPGGVRPLVPGHPVSSSTIR